MVEIKDRLSEALRIRGLIPVELARLTGINKGSISRYLKGEIIPKQSAIGSMARVLRVSPAWLMGYDVEMESNVIKEASPEDIDISRLTPENLIRLKAYFQCLIDSQEEAK